MLPSRVNMSAATLYQIDMLPFLLTDELTEFVKGKDEEIERLEAEAAGYRDDIDNMFESFQQREQELRQELTATEHKAQVKDDKENKERLLLGIWFNFVKG